MRHNQLIIILQTELITASLPLWVAKLGDRRRLERAWLGWRLCVAGQQIDKAEALMLQRGMEPVRKRSGWVVRVGGKIVKLINGWGSHGLLANQMTEPKLRCSCCSGACSRSEFRSGWVLGLEKCWCWSGFDVREVAAVVRRMGSTIGQVT